MVVNHVPQKISGTDVLTVFKAWQKHYLSSYINKEVLNRGNYLREVATPFVDCTDVFLIDSS